MFIEDTTLAATGHSQEVRVKRILRVSLQIFSWYVVSSLFGGRKGQGPLTKEGVQKDIFSRKKLNDRREPPPLMENSLIFFILVQMFESL